MIHDEYLPFTECSLCPKHYSKHLTCINSFNLSTKSLPITTMNVQMKHKGSPIICPTSHSTAMMKKQAFCFREWALMTAFETQT